jgi:hypothetical protein
MGWDISTLRMSSVYTTLCGQTKHGLRLRVYSTSTAVTFGHRIILTISEELGIKSASALVFGAGIVDDVVMGTYLVPDKLSAPWHRDFLRTVLPGLLEVVTLAARQRLWFQQDGAPARYEEDIIQWLKPAYPERCIRSRGPISCPPRSSDLTPTDFLLPGHLKGHGYAVPPRTIEDLVARPQAAVTTADANMACWRKYFSAHCCLP